MQPAAPVESALETAASCMGRPHYHISASEWSTRGKCVLPRPYSGKPSWRLRRHASCFFLAGQGPGVETGAVFGLCSLQNVKRVGFGGCFRVIPSSRAFIWIRVGSYLATERPRYAQITETN